MSDGTKFYRHRGRETVYEKLGMVRLQSDKMIGDNTELVLYAGPDGVLWVRPEHEFNLTRFEPINMVEREKDTPSLDETLAAVGQEVLRAEAMWPALNSAHEAFAVMDEERDEVWEHVKMKQSKRDLPAMRKELIQVAAMAIRFVRDVIDGQRGRK